MKPNFVLSPKSLPNSRRVGRAIMLDLAFASGGTFLSVTKPFIAGLGDRLIAWIDHHPHPAWADYADDPRFILVDKQTAPACPELIDPALVTRLGEIDTILAHGDFDGCLAAAKFLRGGIEPYPGADTDARAIDAPGRGFVCSARGLRLAHAMDQVKSSRRGARSYIAFLERLTAALVAGAEPEALREELDDLAAAQRQRLVQIEPMLEQATQPHPEIVLLRAPVGLSASDRKALLCQLEERATFALVETGPRVTVATFADDRFDLSDLPGLEGSRGLAWGKVSSADLLRHLAALCREE